MSTAETKVGLSTSAAFVAVAVCLAMASAGCFEGGEISNDTGLTIQTDAVSDTDEGDEDGESMGDTEQVSDATADGGDTTDPCGGCSGAKPVCDTGSGTCVECLKNDHCPSTGKTVCDTNTNTCVACVPMNEKEWYPDGDGDSYGDANATPQKACDPPMQGMVDNGEDCDDSNKDVNPDADEICNGRDDDCDGDDDTQDSNIKAGNCSKQKGVCSGATIASCNMSGSDYASCGAMEYGNDYRKANDEIWRCDSKDNDCDGNTDEACCKSGNTPSPIQIGPNGNDQSHPVIVPAAQGAPSGATWLAAWAEGSTLKLQHVDETGKKVGSSSSKNLGFEVRAVGVAGHGNGYGAVVARKAVSGHELNLLRTDTSLNQQGTVKSVDANATGRIGGVSIVNKASTAWLVYSFEKAGGGHIIKAAAVNLSNGNVSTSPFRVSKSGQTLPKAGLPEIAIVGGTPTVVWWDAGNSKVRGARISGGMAMGQDRFSAGVNAANKFDAEAMEIVASNGKAGVIFPDYTMSGKAALKYLSVGAGQTGSVMGAKALTGTSKVNRQPTASAVDTDGDGTADRLLVVWAQGNTNDPAIMVGQTSLGSPSMIGGKTVAKSFPDVPDLAVSGERSGMVWLNTSTRTSKDVKYAPLSIDGVGVCSP